MSNWRQLPPKNNQARDAEVVALRAQGRSLRQVADRFGISRERVRQIEMEQAWRARRPAANAPSSEDPLEVAYARGALSARLYRAVQRSHWYSPAKFDEFLAWLKTPRGQQRLPVPYLGQVGLRQLRAAFLSPTELAAVERQEAETRPGGR